MIINFGQWAVGCENMISEEVQLRVEGPLTVLEHPQDVVECAGNAVTFSAEIDNPGYTPAYYRWQVSPDSGVTWFNLTNNPIYGGVSSSQLIIVDVTAMNGYQFRMQADAGTCSYIHTEPATITSEGPIIYSQANDPQDVTVCQGGSFWFVSNASLAQAGTMKYQWQVSSDDGINWTDITAVTDGGVYSGFDSPELYGVSAAGLYNRCYRLAFSTGECSKVYSNVGCLNVQGEISITDQPDDIIVCSNEPALFVIDVEDISPDYVGDESHIKYQWQESTDGGISWIDLADGLILDGGSGVAGVNTDTFAVIEKAGRNGHLFRAKVWTDVCDVIFSDAATFYFNSEIAIIDHPDDISVCPGEGVTFSAAVQNPSGVDVYFQWETNANNGLNWSNASDGSPNGFSGVNTNQLAISDVTDLYDHRFRLKAWTNECDTIWSNYALLTVEGPIAFTDQPDDATICFGEPVCFSVEAMNFSESVIPSPITYQWQLLFPGTGVWQNLQLNQTFNGSFTPTMCISDVAGLDSAQFRVLIQTANCAFIASEPALLSVEGPISFTRHPEDFTQCWGGEAYFVSDAMIAPGNAGSLSYQWQHSPDGLNWSDISDGGVQLFSGSTTDSLVIGNVAGLHNTYYRLSVNTGVCTEVYSFDAELSVEGPLEIVEHPQDVFVCPDKEIFLSSKISNGALIGLDGVLFQWETSADGGLTWTDLYNGDNGTNVINGAESDSLLIAPATGFDGHQFRLKTWSVTCDTLVSEVATVHHFCPESILLKLGYDPLYEVWSVFVAPEDGFVPTGSSELLSGRVTFAASSDFVPGNLLSFTGGDWEPGAVLLDAPENPGMNYFTFDLEPDGAPFLLENANEVKLFSFKNTLGQCPDSLYLVNDFRPALVHENEVKGVSIVGGSAEDFSIGGYYGKAWNCSFTSGGINNPIDSLANGNSGSLFFAAGGNNDHMSLAPNPASDYLNVNISMENTEYQWLVRMVNLHGQSLQTHFAAGQATLRLDLNHLPTGLYFLSLERDGKVIQREKFMKE